MDITKILVPVDFSEPSKRAVNYGLSLALQFKARLVLAHIVPTNIGLGYTFLTETFAVEKDRATHAKSMLPTLIPEEYRDLVNLNIVVKIGNVKDELLGMIKDEKVDLVVMGTHGNSGFQRYVLGSLTERMLRQVPVALLTVSHLDPALEPHDARPVPLRKILYASDLSDNARFGLRSAVELARRTGARLTVLHVLTAAETIYWGAEGGYLAQDLEMIREAAAERLRLSIDPEWLDTVNIVPLMSEGSAFREILRVADEEKINLIVMNLQGKGLIERALLGSTAERVIRSAHVPVLSIPVTVSQQHVEPESTVADRKESLCK
jgi:nucleotide-binding universal stress UspA family protein